MYIHFCNVPCAGLSLTSVTYMYVMLTCTSSHDESVIACCTLQCMAPHMAPHGEDRVRCWDVALCGAEEHVKGISDTSVRWCIGILFTQH